MSEERYIKKVPIGWGRRIKYGDVVEIKGKRNSSSVWIKVGNSWEEMPGEVAKECITARGEEFTPVIFCVCPEEYSVWTDDILYHAWRNAISNAQLFSGVSDKFSDGWTNVALAMREELAKRGIDERTGKRRTSVHA